MCLSQEVLDKPAIEVREAKESSNIIEVMGYWPVSNSGDLTLVYANTTRLDNHPEVLQLAQIPTNLLLFLDTRNSLNVILSIWPSAD